MPNFNIITNRSEIDSYNDWSMPATFVSKNRLVDVHGKKLTTNHNGHIYKIIEKRERSLSGAERFGRGFLGVIIVICTLGTSLFSSRVRKLFSKDKEYIRFGILEPQKEIAAPAPTVKLAPEAPAKSETSTSSPRTIPVISSETTSKIQSCMKAILSEKASSEVRLYHCQREHRVFSLESAPGLIFKMNDNSREISVNQTMSIRFEKMNRAQTIIHTHNLGLLVIPRSHLFTLNFEGQDYEIIAEERLDINPLESRQEEYFHEHSASLNEAIRQLSIFICYTGYSDVEWRNNPVLVNSLDEHGNRKIALIDLELMETARIGLFGGWGRRGLVRCVTVEQGLIVERTARELGVPTDDFSTAHQRRIEEIEANRRVKEFYTARKISGGEPIRVDEQEIDFSEFPEQAEELRKITKKLVETINGEILKTSSDESLTERRAIFINTNQIHFCTAASSLIRPGENEFATRRAFKTAEECQEATYLGFVVKKLINLRIIYGLIKRNGHGYFLQV